MISTPTTLEESTGIQQEVNTSPILSQSLDMELRTAQSTGSEETLGEKLGVKEDSSELSEEKIILLLSLTVLSLK